MHSSNLFPFQTVKMYLKYTSLNVLHSCMSRGSVNEVIVQRTLQVLFLWQSIQILAASCRYCEPGPNWLLTFFAWHRAHKITPSCPTIMSRKAEFRYVHLTVICRTAFWNPAQRDTRQALRHDDSTDGTELDRVGFHSCSCRVNRGMRTRLSAPPQTAHFLS